MRRPSLVFYIFLVTITLYTGFLSFFVPLGLAAVAAILARFFVFEKLAFFRGEVPKNIAVVVTGCSSGFGHDLAISLAKKGVLVFATVRKEADGIALTKGVPGKFRQNLKFVLCDIAKSEQITDCVATVTENLQGKDLYAVVNNAGYSVIGGLNDKSSSENGRKMFDVNVFGTYEFTMAFAPLLRETQKKGTTPRILCVSSSAGVQSVLFDLLGFYTASKGALEALADGMSRELGFHLTIVEPGGFQTEMFKKLQTQIHNTAQAGDGDKATQKMAVKAKDMFEGSNLPSEFDVITRSYEYALFSRFPPHRMLVGFDAYLLGGLANLLPDSVLFKLAKAKPTLE
eukprot:TRINITY_DN656_c0_g1_i1.p1 TRINITY_DN656_c0_g1~~TRINITY_DN656_c0_g1_i1.p1  ORF type:complete len:343 (-),score=85.30 TRINITY_DN656_c0_g1_i1:68-1096(-)